MAAGVGAVGVGECLLWGPVHLERGGRMGGHGERGPGDLSPQPFPDSVRSVSASEGKENKTKDPEGE